MNGLWLSLGMPQLHCRISRSSGNSQAGIVI